MSDLKDSLRRGPDPAARRRRLLSACVIFVGLLGAACAQTAAPAPAAPTAETPQMTATPLVTPAPTPTPEPTPFSILWLSDTQTMAYAYPDALLRMGEWIAQNRVLRNIVFAVQTGDAVEHGANDAQWAAFDGCYEQFRQEIPLLAIAGNHDIGVREKDYAFFLRRPYLGALPQEQTFAGGKGVYQTLYAGGLKLLILGAGWDAELAAVDWMNEVLAKYRDHRAVLLFHGFMGRDGHFTQIGQKLYTAVVAPNPNVRMVLCGHIPGHFSRTEAFDDDGDGTPDRSVHMMLYNFQDIGLRCGQLRLLTIEPQTGDVRVETYSPVTDVQYRAFPYREPIYTVEGLLQ